jgi:hypothetical protein
VTDTESRYTWEHQKYKQATKATNEGMRTVNLTQGHKDSGSKIKKHGSRHQTQTERQGHRGGESDQNKTRDKMRHKEKYMQIHTQTKKRKIHRNRNSVMEIHRKRPRD